MQFISFNNIMLRILISYSISVRSRDDAGDASPKIVLISVNRIPYFVYSFCFKTIATDIRYEFIKYKII